MGALGGGVGRGGGGRGAALLLLALACTPTGAGDDGSASASATTSGTSSSSGSTSASSTGEGTSAATLSTSAEATGSSGEATTSSGGPGTSASTETSGEGSSSSGGEPALVSLKITPPDALITVASGWSHPVGFTVVGVDGEGVEVAVDATWTVKGPALGEITAKGGAFQATNTAAGVTSVEASAAGLSVSAEVTIELLGDHPSCAVPRPPLTDGEPAPGAFRRVVAPEYEGTGVYHGVYLPPDWQPGRRYPVIVESPCNKYQSFTGKVDDATLGYELAGCRSYIWVVVPYVDIGGQQNLDYGWGDVPATIAYWAENVPRALAAYGGDPGSVIVTGFSRGAIGASYVGLNNEAIADLWLAFYMHSHADVPSNLTPDAGAGSSDRMARVWGRRSLLSWGAVGDGGAANSIKGVTLLESFGYPVATLAVPGVGHTDAWMADDPASRAIAQSWLFDAIAGRPGTHTIRGRVVDEGEGGVAGATIRSGAHAVITDAHGYYALRGLVPGVREVACEHPELVCAPPQVVDISDGDGIVDFAALVP